MRFPVRRAAPLVVVVVALTFYLPRLSENEWQAGCGRLVEIARRAAPTIDSGRFLYEILAAAAASLLPSAPLALNLLALIGAVATAMVVMRLRRLLFPDAAEFEHLLAALALIVSGPFWLHATAADVHTVATLVTTLAIAVAWSGRPVMGAALYTGAFLVSTSAAFVAPMLIFAVRDRRSGLLAGAWLLVVAAVVLVVRPRVLVPALTVEIPAPVAEALVMGIGCGALLPLLITGCIGDWRRTATGRRFVAAVLVSIVLTTIAHSTRFTMGAASIVLLPWCAVLVGGSWPVIRRQLGRYGYGPRAALTVVGVHLAVGGWLAERYLVAPTWRRGDEFHALSRAVTDGYHDVAVVGSEGDVALYKLAQLERRALPAFELSTALPRERLPGAALLGEVEGLAESSNLLLVLERRAMMRLDGGTPVGEPLPAANPNRVRESLGEFAGGLRLRQARVVPPRPRAGVLLGVLLNWETEAPVEPVPRVIIAIVDGRGAVRHHASYWWGGGLAPPAVRAGGISFQEQIVLRLPADLEVGEYGVEVAVYEPRRGDALVRDLGLGYWRQERRMVAAAATPRGVTAASLRAATLRIDAVALRREDGR